MQQGLNKITVGLITATCAATLFVGTSVSNAAVPRHGDAHISTTSLKAPTAVTPDASTAAAIRALLTAQLVDHVWLAGNALDTAVRKGGNLKDPAVKGAVAAVDANSVALAKTVGSIYPKAEAAFLASWRQHIGFFVDYTLGKATKNAKMVAKAKSDLDGYRTSFGQLINSVIPELPADAVAKELILHVSTLFTAIDASVAGSPSYQSKLAAAAAHMPMTAQILTSGIVKNKGITN